MFRPSRLAAIALIAVAAMPVTSAGAAEAEADHTHGGGLPFIDARADDAPAKVPAARVDAREELAADLGDLGTVRTDREGGGIDWIANPGELLTGPSGAAPEQVALDYVREHRDVFGLSDGDIANLKVVARSVDPTGITHLRFNQVLSGYESFDSGLDAHVTKAGELVSVSGAAVPGAKLADRKADLQPTDGLAQARDAVDGAGVPSGVEAPSAGGSEPTKFSSGEQARLRWVATSDGPMLVWNVTADGEDGHAYDVLVDADSGDLVRRQDLVAHAGEAIYFPRDPLHTAAKPIVMPAKWYDDHANGSRLWGQYSRTYVDYADQDPAAGSEAVNTRAITASATGAAPKWQWIPAVFAASPCPSSGCTWNSATASTSLANESQTGTNVHVLTSKFHDHLASGPIGFDEASGNFQRTNTSGQGIGNDYVRTEVNDGSGMNNANFMTPPDGQAPRMQMYLWDTVDINGSDVADIVYHEYGHGLSNRLIVNASGASTLSSRQGLMMGEAWGDFYALDLLQSEGALVDTPAPGEVVSGSYMYEATTGNSSPNTSGGIRAKAIDCPVNNASGTIRCNDNGSSTIVTGGYTYGDLAKTYNVTGDGTFTPHNGGEVWAETLWDIRSEPSIGRIAALALITGGMRLSPDSPSMLDMRDSILQQAVAMRSAPGAANDHSSALWSIFAKRGMGPNASTVSAESLAPTESFGTVDLLQPTLSDTYPLGDADGKFEIGESISFAAMATLRSGSFLAANAYLHEPSANVSLIVPNASFGTLTTNQTTTTASPLTVKLVGSCVDAAKFKITVESPTGPSTRQLTLDPRTAQRAVQPLVDNGTATSTLAIDASGAITDVDVRIDDLRHTFLGDLTVSISHAGTTVLLLDPTDSNSGNDVIDAIFDDEAVTLAPTNQAPVTGRVKPRQLLSQFDGKPAAGDWTLKILDQADVDTGELRSWGLNTPQIPCSRAEIPVSSTSDAASVTHDTATMTGAVTPNGRATNLRFSYGTTTSYGATTALQDAGAGDAAFSTGAALVGLSPNTTYHYRVEAIREGGVMAVAGEDRTFTTGPVPVAVPPTAVAGATQAGIIGPVLDRTAPAFLKGVKVTLSKKPKNKPKAPQKPTYEFQLSEPGAVAATLTKAAPGIKAGKKCIAPPKPKPGAKPKPCVRQLPAGSASAKFASAGAAKLKLVGKALGAGTYTATLVATDATGNRSKPTVVTFKVK